MIERNERIKALRDFAYRRKPWLNRQQSPEAIAPILRIPRWVNLAAAGVAALFAGNFPEYPVERLEHIKFNCSRDENGEQQIELDVRPIKDDIRRGRFSLVLRPADNSEVFVYPYSERVYEGVIDIGDLYDSAWKFPISEEGVTGGSVELREGSRIPEEVLSNTTTVLERLVISPRVCASLDV